MKHRTYSSPIPPIRDWATSEFESTKARRDRFLGATAAAVFLAAFMTAVFGLTQLALAQAEIVEALCSTDMDCFERFCAQDLSCDGGPEPMVQP